MQESVHSRACMGYMPDKQVAKDQPRVACTMSMWHNTNVSELTNQKGAGNDGWKKSSNVNKVRGRCASQYTRVLANSANVKTHQARPTHPAAMHSQSPPCASLQQKLCWHPQITHMHLSCNIRHTIAAAAAQEVSTVIRM